MTIACFSGAKLALLRGPDLVTILRDDLPHIPWPGHWDLPGGGREDAETPLDCALRETEEELGLKIPRRAIGWSRLYPGPEPAGCWFFAAELPELDPARIRMGDEGQEWRLMPVAAFLAQPLAVPHLRDRLRDYLAERPRS